MRNDDGLPIFAIFMMRTLHRNKLEPIRQKPLDDLLAVPLHVYLYTHLVDFVNAASCYGRDWGCFSCMKPLLFGGGVGVVAMREHRSR